MSRALRPVAALLTVTALANTGTRIMALAVPWFVLLTTGSAAKTGLVAAFELGPYVLCKALSGPVLDRIGQRRLSIGADLASAVTIGLIPVLHVLGLLSLPLLLVLVAIAGGLRGPGDTAKHTAVPLVAELGHLPLERVTGLSGAIERGSGLVAPALAAVMIELVSAPGAVALTAGCFALSAVIAALGLPGSIDAHEPAAAERVDTEGGYLRRLRAGWAFLVRDRLLLTLVLMIMATNLLDIAKTAVLLPVWARDAGHGVRTISLLLVCMAAFSMISSLFASWLGPRLPRRFTYFAAFAVAGPPPFVALAFDLPVWSLAAIYCVAGFASGFLNPMIGAILFERIPRPLLGRVGALADAVAWSAMPFGGLVGAALIGAAGLSPAFAIAAAAYTVAMLVPALASRASFDPPAGEPVPEFADAGAL